MKRREWIPQFTFVNGRPKVVWQPTDPKERNPR